MAASGAPTTLQQEMAALLYAGPGSVITGPAALRSHHIRTELTDIVDVLVPAARRRRDTQFVRLHRTTRMPERIWQAGPVRYAPPPREDHARTLARGRRMARHQIVVLRFTPRQIRTQRTAVISDIKAALEGARDRSPLALRTVPAGHGTAA